MPTFATTLTRVRGRLTRWLVRSSYALFGAGAALGLVAAAFPEATREVIRTGVGAAIGWSAMTTTLATLLVLAFARRSAPGQITTPELLATRSTDGELVLTFRGREHRIPLAELAGGHVVPAHRGIGPDNRPIDVPPQVVLETRGGDVWRVNVEDVARGFEVLASVGLGARDRTLEITRRKGGSVIATLFLVLVASPVLLLPTALAALALPPSTVGIFGLLLVFRAASSILRRLQPSPLAIGADGVAWREGWRRRRFVPHRDIEDVRLETVGALAGRVLVLETKSGPVHIPLGPLEYERLEATVAHLKAARGEARATMDALGRGGREFEEWKADVEALLREGYRQARVPKVRVLETLEDPHAPADQRLGAAMALASTDPTRAHEVAREVARACADRELAEALEALIESRLDAPRAERVAGE